MYTSPELDAATKKLIEHARKNNVILGLFLFGTPRVGEFLEKGFTFISVGNDLHHLVTQAGPTSPTWKNLPRKKASLGSVAHRAVLESSKTNWVPISIAGCPTLVAFFATRVGILTLATHPPSSHRELQILFQAPRGSFLHIRFYPRIAVRFHLPEFSSAVILQ